MNMHMKPAAASHFAPARVDLTSIFWKVVAFWLHLRRLQEARRARAALHSFDDRMLRDIGIQRGEIDLLLRHGRHGTGGD
jgi:uncharacterized protein YjiS (DUF1127 family)